MAVAVTLAMAAMASPSSAGFLYVPALEAVTAEAGASGGNTPEAIAHAGGRMGTRTLEAPTAESGPALWRVRAGETLRDALGRWGERAGVEVAFLTDRRYRLHEGRAFDGSFGDAAIALFAALSHLPHPPAGELRSGGSTLAVLHRLRSAGDGQ